MKNILALSLSLIALNPFAASADHTYKNDIQQIDPALALHEVDASRKAEAGMTETVKKVDGTTFHLKIEDEVLAKAMAATEEKHIVYFYNGHQSASKPMLFEKYKRYCWLNAATPDALRILTSGDGTIILRVIPGGTKITTSITSKKTTLYMSASMALQGTVGLSAEESSGFQLGCWGGLPVGSPNEFTVADLTDNFGDALKACELH